MSRKPKPYRKTKVSKGSDLAKFKVNEGGGRVQGIIIGPETSTGTTTGSTIAHPKAEQGRTRGTSE
jgi:hypothetical protein